MDYHPEITSRRNNFDYTELSENEYRKALELAFENKESGFGYGDMIEVLRNSYAPIVGATYGIGKVKKLLAFLKNKRMIVQNNNKQYVFNSKFYY